MISLPVDKCHLCCHHVALSKTAPSLKSVVFPRDQLVEINEGCTHTTLLSSALQIKEFQLHIGCKPMSCRMLKMFLHLEQGLHPRLVFNYVSHKSRIAQLRSNQNDVTLVALWAHSLYVTTPALWHTLSGDKWRRILKYPVVFFKSNTSSSTQ